MYAPLPPEAITLAASTPNSVLLATSRPDSENHRSHLFLNPIEILTAHTLEDLPDLFRRIELALARDHHVAGYLTYEAGYHFERFAEAPLPQNIPLAWFGVYQRPLTFDHTQGIFDQPLPSDIPTPAPLEPTFANNATLDITEDEYAARLARIHNYIAAGDTYQVNFTAAVTARTPLRADPAFRTLSAIQPVAYSALINLGARQILSLSPELFFRIENNRITTRPMKGTMPRGLDLAEDAEQAQRLAADEKNRSEHIMIVDLLRNDLGRICAPGTVVADPLFHVEQYRTLLQMTSTITGALRPGLTFYEIFRALFPSGSITGAPKIRTMQIIRELERAPRGIYTGAIGHIAPDRSATFNVAIRTLVLEDHHATMGVGGGIVADSTSADEYRECLLKAGFLTRHHNDHALIETIRIDRNHHLPHLALHLDRLRSSARYFDYTIDRAATESRIHAHARRQDPHQQHRLRLLLSSTGELTLTSTPFTPDNAHLKVLLATHRTHSTDLYLRHKTTHRATYDTLLAQARARGYDELLFLNERNELTEGAISNLFVERNGHLLTPPLTSGLLPGILRRHLLETNPQAREQTLYLEDLAHADALYLGNALRGLRKISIVDPPNPEAPRNRVPPIWR